MTEVIVLDHEADFGRAVTTLMNEQPVVVNGVPLNFERLAQLAALSLRSSSLTEGVDYVVLSAQVPKPNSNSRLDFVVNYATSQKRLDEQDRQIEEQAKLLQRQNELLEKLAEKLK